MYPNYAPGSPSDFVMIIAFIAIAVPGILASWKQPYLAFSAVFMSLCAAVFAVSGNKMTSDLVFASIWAGSMLLAGMSRLADAVDAFRNRLDAPLDVRTASDEAGSP